MARQIFIISLLTLLGTACTDKNVEPEGRNRVFLVGEEACHFTDAAFLDTGYDKAKNVYPMVFMITGEPLVENPGDIVDFKYVIAVNAVTKGKQFKFGSFSLDNNAELFGELVFHQKGESTFLKEGIFKIVKEENGDYSLFVDGLLDDNRTIKGNYTGRFYGITIKL